MEFISRFTLAVVIAAAVYLLVRGDLFAVSLFLVVQIAAVGLMIWARRSFDQDQFSIGAEPKGNGMFATGPYRYIRHPMYAGALAIIWSGILGHITPLNLAVGLVATIAVAARVIVEEKFLRSRYPDYAAYTVKTKRLIPFII